MELTVENLRKIQRIDQEQGGGITWNDLVELFGKEIWYLPNDDRLNPGDLNIKINEERLIRTALSLSVNQTEAAKLLGISPRAMTYKLKKLRGEL
jgi:transcriptional regulator with PAS, ATPase and Fis domain